jgi:hypothetical protein
MPNAFRVLCEGGVMVSMLQHSAALCNWSQSLCKRIIKYCEFKKSGEQIMFRTIMKINYDLESGKRNRK